MARKVPASTIVVKGKEYDVNSDFSWKELMLVEELCRQPLGAPGAFESAATSAAFIFVILKREDTALTWEAFIESPVSDLEDAPASNGDGPPTKARGSNRRAAAGTQS